VCGDQEKKKKKNEQRICGMGALQGIMGCHSELWHKKKKFDGGKALRVQNAKADMLT
jgi:hypothetical protein